MPYLGHAAAAGYLPEVVVVLLLVLSAFLAGVVNAMAGGGTLLTFPALLWAGVPAVTANATSTVSLVPGSVAAAWGYRDHVRADRRLLVALAIPSVVGGTLGALAADRIGDDRFADLAPLLVLIATVLFVVQEPLRRWSRVDPLAADPPARHLWTIAAYQLGVALYGGFFGAGIGILMLAALGMLGLDDIHRMNGLKNVAAVCINGLAAVTFALSGRVDWPLALVMGVGGIAGGWSGAALARWVGPLVVRRVVVGVGVAMALALAWSRYS